MIHDTVTPLMPPQLAAAAQLHALCFPDDPWSEHSLRELLESPGIAGWVITDAEILAQLAGLLLTRLAADEAEILTLCVAPLQRHRGAAGRLLETALPALAALGARRLFLEVAQDNEAARGLYHRYGFSRIGYRPAYYRRANGARAAALVLALDLSPPKN